MPTSTDKSTSKLTAAARRGALRGAARLGLRYGALLLAIGFAQAQDDAVQRLVAGDAARWIGHADPIVRGEAALVLAGLHDPRNHGAILRVAQDSEEPARLRGLIALGMQATAGVVVVLDEALRDQSERTGPAGICAAYALGSLPPAHASAVVTRTLSSFLDSNWKRQGPVLLALLHGMARQPQHHQVVVLKQLYDERANRNPAIRSMLLRLLLAADATMTEERVLDLLRHASPEERLAVLDWLVDNPTDYDDRLIDQIERIARSGNRAELRAQALAVLTRLRHPPAIEIAVDALGSSEAVEVEQGMHSALAIGGASMRLALERHLLDATEPVLIAAMLRSWAAPPSDELADHCAALAADRERPMSVRTAAATILSRTDTARAAPLLRDVFRAARNVSDLGELARAIVRTSEPVPALARLLPNPEDPTLCPEHWRALLAESHPGATRHLLQVLETSRSPTAELRAALTSWRMPMVTGRQLGGGTELPEPLPALLCQIGR
ncbi:MAG: hypothetical protein KDC98_15720 [Planctomycetes bacterium]|nr:hypothetical protein [Planctomycetota bacterium]